MMVHQKATPQKRKATVSTDVIMGYNQAWRQAKAMRRPNSQIGGFLGLELKFLDLTIVKEVGNALDAGAMFDPTTPKCWNAVPIGTGQSQRTGRQIRMKTFEMQGYCRMNPAALESQQGHKITIWVICDKQTNEAQMTAVQALVSQTDVNLNASTFPNLEWKERFVILEHKVITVNSQNTVTNVSSSAIVRPFSIAINLHNLLTTFDTSGDGGTIATITDNSIHVIALDSHGSTVDLKFVGRLRYVDA